MDSLTAGLPCARTIECGAKTLVAVRAPSIFTLRSGDRGLRTLPRTVIFQEKKKRWPLRLIPPKTRRKARLVWRGVHDTVHVPLMSSMRIHQSVHAISETP